MVPGVPHTPKYPEAPRSCPEAPHCIPSAPPAAPLPSIPFPSGIGGSGPPGRGALGTIQLKGQAARDAEPAPDSRGRPSKRPLVGHPGKVPKPGMRGCPLLQMRPG